MGKRGGSNNRLFAAIRLYAVKERPYFASALFAMTAVERPGHGTFSIDKYARVYWDPELFDPSTLDKRKKANPDAVTWEVVDGGVGLIHEIGHWIRKHFERAEGYIENAECQLCEARLCNVAEDLSINSDLAQEFAHARTQNPNNPPRLLESDPVPKHYKFAEHRPWEEYYELLKKKRGPTKKHAHRVILCGSAAHGIPMPYELPAPSDVNHEQGIREAEGDLIRKAVAKELQQYANKNPGSVAAGWELWANTLLTPPQVPWEQELAALIRSAVTTASGMVDYSYTKPSRRGLFNGVVMPSLRRPKPEVCVVVDTSGSMAEGDLLSAISEVDGICKAIGQDSLPVICCDADAYGVQKVTRGSSVNIVGGGGTDMGVGIAEAQKLKCEVIVVLTDGFTPWPDEPPRGAQLVVGIIRSEDEEEPLAEEDWAVPAYAKRTLRIKSQRREAA